MINCIYHPVYPMMVVDDEEYANLLASGEWFKHPNEAKSMRKDYEEQIRRDTRKRGRPSKSNAEDARSSS